MGTQLRLVETRKPRGTRRSRPRPRRVTATDWRLDPGLRQVGQRRVAEARRVLAAVRHDPLAEAS